MAQEYELWRFHELIRNKLAKAERAENGVEPHPPKTE